MTRRLLAAVLLLMLLCGQAQADMRRIGVSVMDMGNPYFTEIARGVEETARRVTGHEVEVIASSCAYDLQRQIEQLDRFIEMRVDLIVLTAVDPQALKPVIARAQAAGIRVIGVDVAADSADATVMTDNLDAGRQACEFIAKRLKGRGNLLIINGPRLSSVIDRVQGCMEVVKRNPGLRVLSSDRDAGGSTPGGFAVMTDLLGKHPKVDAVFTINDPTALGAERAAAQARRSEFFIVSVDGSPRVVRSMRAPNARIAATVAQRPSLEAQRAVEIGAQLLAGAAPPAQAVLIPVYVVTPQSPEAAEKPWR
jgi:ribose transport system substrate-binding protein